MKAITYITRYFPVHSQTFIVNQIINTKQAEFDVSVLTYNQKDINHSSQKQLLIDYNIESSIHKIDFNFPKKSSVRYIKAILLFFRYFKYSSKISYKSLSDFLFFKPYLINYFYNYRNVDIFHVHFADAGLDIASMKKARLLKGDIILSLHGFSVHFQTENERIKLYSTYKELFEQSKFITVNSEYLLNKIISLGCNKNKIHILPMGINTDFYYSTESKEIISTLKLISVGRLIELKGHEYGIKSVKQLIENGVDLEYTIVGEGILKKRLIELVKALNIEKNVIFLGKQTQTELKQLYSKNHIFLMTSITDKQGRAEAQGLVTLEAQAMGLPVVAFDSGGVKSTLNSKTGILVKEKSTTEFAQAILKLCNDKSLYKNMSENAITFVNQNFALNKLSKRVIELYD